MDPRYTRLAELLVRHSTRLQKDEHVLIEAFDIPVEMTVALMRAFVESPHPRCVAISRDETTSVMVNEEDHLRLQMLAPGLQLRPRPPSSRSA